ncbi:MULTISPECIES: hypothetical protein [unclassified Microcoleus]|uniref:hypothetical protein n=1 Tax=unclassified Microcoleus TaxID=2642155 RepID=UPI002FD1957F
MSENEELNPSDNEETVATSPETNVEELAEVIAEFEKYRERLVNETMTAAQKAKLPPKAAMAKIEPELAKIDAGLDSLRAQLAALTTNN